VIKSLKNNDNRKSSKKENSDNNNTSLNSNSNKVNQISPKLEFYEKLKSDLMNNLNIIFENKSYNIGNMVNNSEDYYTLISLLEKKFEISKNNLESIFNSHVSSHLKIKIELNKNNAENDLFTEIAELKVNDSIAKKSFGNMLDAFKSISELEISLFPVLEILERIKSIFQIKKSIEDIDKIIEEGLENSINLINRIKLENPIFDSIKNQSNIYNENKILNLDLKASSKLANSNEPSKRIQKLEKAKIILLNKSTNNMNKLSFNAQKILENSSKNSNVNATKENFISEKNNLVKKSILKSMTEYDMKMDKFSYEKSSGNKIQAEEELNKFQANNINIGKQENSNGIFKKSVMNLELFRCVSNSKYIAVDEYKIFGENFSNEIYWDCEEKKNSFAYKNIGNTINKLFWKILFKESVKGESVLKERQHQNMISRLASVLNTTLNVIKNIQNHKTFLDLEIFREGIIGRNTIYRTPFGESIAFYADDTSSGRPHRIIEDYIQSILPLYANTHSDNSFFAVTFNALYYQAQRYLIKLFNAPENQYTVIQAGNGATEAIARWQEILYSKFPHILTNNILELKKRQEMIVSGNTQNLPVVILTEYEHHSNILSWEKWGFECIPIKSSIYCEFDDESISDLSNKLHVYCEQRQLVIIITNAASKITSQTSPLEKISKVISNIKLQNPALTNKIIWSINCSSYASHKLLNIKELKADAIFLSPHKITGGTASCGLLILNNEFYPKEEDPTQTKVATVEGVYGYTRKEIIFNKDIAVKETAKNPGIIQLIRAAAAFQLLERVGLDNIDKRENYLSKLVFDKIKDLNFNWKNLGVKNHIEILGIQDCTKRQSVIACVFYNELGSKMPYQFCHRLMSDLFGIQLNSSCNCAGSFSVNLLKLEEREINSIEDKIREGDLTIRPGWVRFNVHFSFTDEDIDYLIYCLKFLTEQGTTIMNKLYTRNDDGSYLMRSQFILSNLTKHPNNNKENKENNQNKENKTVINEDNIIFKNSTAYTAKTNINMDDVKEKYNNKLQKIDKQSSLNNIYDNLMLNIFDPFQTREVHESERSFYLQKRIEFGNSIIDFIRNQKLS